MGLKEAWAALCGVQEKRDHGAVSFKAGTRPAIILQALCEGKSVSGWSACMLLQTHNGDRELRRVRSCLRALGLQFSTLKGTTRNGREYKITKLLPSSRSAALKLIVGRAS